MMSCVPNDGDWRGNFISRAEASEKRKWCGNLRTSDQSYPPIQSGALERAGIGSQK